MLGGACRALKRKSFDAHVLAALVGVDVRHGNFLAGQVVYGLRIGPELDLRR
jgi:hypothetical protein